jgi:serine/threonine-protein kinase HipA
MRLDDLYLWYLADPAATALGIEPQMGYPTHSGQGQQEFLCGALGHESTLDNAMSDCPAFGLLPHEAALEVARVIAVVDHWKTHFALAGVTPADIEYLAQFIDGDGLLAQRTDPGRFQQAGAKRRQPAKPGPFRT